MSGTSGRTLRTPFAYYDPESRSLRTSQGTFGWDSIPSSPTLPPSGSMRDGRLYEHPTSALRTVAHGCSSSPGRQFATPTASIAKGGRPSGSRGKRDLRLDLLPTPRTSDTNGAGAHGTGGPDLRTVVALLPTPRARDGKGRDPNPRGVDLNEAVTLLPTPRATDGTKGGPNQRGSSGDLMLPSAVQLLPTPTAMDSHGSRNATATRKPDSRHHAGTTLTDVFWTGDHTDPRSAAGSTPPDGQLLLPLSPDAPDPD